MTAPTPMYCFQPYWLHEIYCNGIESSARKYCQNFPVHGCIVRGASCADKRFDRNEYHLLHDDLSFFWCPIMKDLNPRNSFWPNMETVGYRLYSKEIQNSHEFKAVVEIKKDEDGNRHLYACRSFEKGDAITFVSQFEKQMGRLIFGGDCAKRDSSCCNSYVTEVKALRCTKRIVEGEEIIRSSSEYAANDYFERIDRVVLSPMHWKIGRITGVTTSSEGIRNDLIVEYQDGSQENANQHCQLGYCFREPDSDIDY